MVDSLIRGERVPNTANAFVEQTISKKLPNCKPKNISSFTRMIDANNLYGGKMKKFPLPLLVLELFDKREWTDENAQEILNRILNTTDDDKVGYIVEVDFSYLNSLHDIHSNFLLAPKKEKIDECWLSEYQCNLLDNMQIKGPLQV